MANHIATIPKKVSGGEELVVVKRSDFEHFRKWQEEVRNALAKVRRGRMEYKNKKTKTPTTETPYSRLESDHGASPSIRLTLQFIAL